MPAAGPLTLAGLAALGGLAAPDGGGLELVPLPGPPRKGARYPHLARGGDGSVVLSFLVPGKADALGCALWTGSGEEGSWRPLPDVSGPDWFVNWADFPKATTLADGTLVRTWLQRSGETPYAYGVGWRVEGAPGGDPGFLHEDRSPVEHGFVSLVPIGRGGDGAEGSSGAGWGLGKDGLAAVWLDARAMHAEEGGATALYFRTLDAEGGLGPERRLDRRVCDCCQTDMVQADDGAFVVAYRDRSGDEVRDVSIVRVGPDSVSKPRSVHIDGWRTAGCPVNGPALAAGDGRIACAWFTHPEGESPRVLCAFSEDGGRGFGPPVRVDDGDPAGRVDAVSLGGGAFLVGWLETTGEGATWRVRRVGGGAGAQPSLSVAQVPLRRSIGFLRMAPLRDGETVLAWTEEGRDFAVRTALIRSRAE